MTFREWEIAVSYAMTDEFVHKIAGRCSMSRPTVAKIAARFGFEKRNVIRSPDGKAKEYRRALNRRKLDRLWRDKPHLLDARKRRAKT